MFYHNRPLWVNPGFFIFRCAGLDLPYLCCYSWRNFHCCNEKAFCRKESETFADSSDIRKMLKCARSQLAVVRERLYFNTGWTGPSPACVLDEQKCVLDWLSSEGVSHHVYGRLKDDLETLRRRLAPYAHDPSYLRVSITYFNTRQELDKLVDALQRMSKS